LAGDYFRDYGVLEKIGGLRDFREEIVINRKNLKKIYIYLK
jgi:hypothetical protein